MAQLMPLALTVSFFSKIQIGFTFLVPAHLGSPGQNPEGRKMVLITSAEEGGYVFSSVCLSVYPSDYSQTCERILTKFFVGVGHGSRTKWYIFGGDPDHASDPGVRNPDPPDRRRFVLSEHIISSCCCCAFSSGEEYCNVRVSQSMCLSVCLSMTISQKPHVQTSPDFLCMLLLDIFQSFFRSIAIITLRTSGLKGLKIRGRSTRKKNWWIKRTNGIIEYWILAGVKEGPADCIRIDELL